MPVLWHHKVDRAVPVLCPVKCEATSP